MWTLRPHGRKWGLRVDGRTRWKSRSTLLWRRNRRRDQLGMSMVGGCCQVKSSSIRVVWSSFRSRMVDLAQHPQPRGEQGVLRRVVLIALSSRSEAIPTHHSSMSRPQAHLVECLDVPGGHLESLFLKDCQV